MGRLRHWLSSKTAPVLWPDGAEPCPKCHRPIAGAIAPMRLGGFMVMPSISQMRTNAEKVSLCPIDGTLGRNREPQPVVVADARAMCTRLVHELRSAHDRDWAKYFERAAEESDETEFLKWFGHSLAVLLRRGPAVEITVPRDDLAQLLVDVVGTWGPRASST